MKTMYAACLTRVGLSQVEAATLHGVRIDTVKSWCSGRRTVPDFAWADLRSSEAAIVDRSETIREAWEDAGEAHEIDLIGLADELGLMALADFFLTAETQLPLRLRRDSSDT